MTLPISSRTAPDLAPLRDDYLLEPNARVALRWNLVLVWFMRVAALLWIAKGLLAWTAIIGLTSGVVPFETGPTGYRAILIYFAVIDIVAGVGLWLTSAWGGVLWLLAVMSHMILAVFFPRFVSNSAAIVGLFILAIMMYLTISWLAAIDE